MNNDMKCVKCNSDLERIGDFYTCTNPHCTLCGDKDMWQELIRTRKELEQSEICCTEWEKQALDYKAENIALSCYLERTRKALGLALDWLREVAKPEKCDDDLCREFTKRKLAEIKTALEQKDK